MVTRKEKKTKSHEKKEVFCQVEQRLSSEKLNKFNSRIHMGTIEFTNTANYAKKTTTIAFDYIINSEENEGKPKDIFCASG